MKRYIKAFVAAILVNCSWAQATPIYLIITGHVLDNPLNNPYVRTSFTGVLTLELGGAVFYQPNGSGYQEFDRASIGQNTPAITNIKIEAAFGTYEMKSPDTGVIWQSNALDSMNGPMHEVVFLASGTGSLVDAPTEFPPPAFLGMMFRSRGLASDLSDFSSLHVLDPYAYEYSNISLSTTGQLWGTIDSVRLASDPTVPEPGSALLISTAGAAMLMARRRRRNQVAAR